MYLSNLQHFKLHQLISETLWFCPQLCS